VAILIPAHNEEDVLDEALDSAVREVGKANVYLANDASTDATAQIGRHYLGENVNTLAVNSGKAVALHETLERYALHERYHAVFFQDADTILEAGHIAAVRAGLTNGTAFSVGRIESRYIKPKTFFVRYRAYMMWLYNATIRLPQSAMGVVNVLPGSSVMIASNVIKQIDWRRVGEFALYDYHQLIQIKLNKLGGARYVSDSPRAFVREPLDRAAYLKQTRRWWTGIGEIHRAEKLWRKGGWWFMFNNFHVLSWLWSAAYPLLMILGLVVFVGNPGSWGFWVFVAGALWGMAESLVLCSLYVIRTGRVSALPLLPLFVGVMYFESLFFFACFVGWIQAENKGRWQSPSRTLREKGVN